MASPPRPEEYSGDRSQNDATESNHTAMMGNLIRRTQEMMVSLIGIGVPAAGAKEWMQYLAEVLATAAAMKERVETRPAG